VQQAVLIPLRRRSYLFLAQVRFLVGDLSFAEKS
jgi:hypothetical protein